MADVELMYLPCNMKHKYFNSKSFVCQFCNIPSNKYLILTTKLANQLEIKKLLLLV